MGTATGIRFIDSTSLKVARAEAHLFSGLIAYYHFPQKALDSNRAPCIQSFCLNELTLAISKIQLT